MLLFPAYSVRHGHFPQTRRIGVVVGTALAVCAWLVWWAGAMALGADAWAQLPALGLALGVGVIASPVAAAIVTLLHRSTEKESNVQPIAMHGEVDFLLTEPTVRASDEETKRVYPAEPSPDPLDENPLSARVTPSLRWHSMSQELEALLRGPHVGKPMFQLLHPEDVPAVDVAFTKARDDRAVQRVLCRFLIADQVEPQLKPGKKTLRSDTKLLPPLTPGSFVYVRVDVLAKRNKAGAVVGYVCRFLDMTPLVLHKEMELQVARKMLHKAKKRLRNLGKDMDRLKMSYRELYQQRRSCTSASTATASS